MLTTLNDFQFDLTSIQGGGKTAEVARKHVHQVQKFWEHTGEVTPAAFSVKNLNSWVESVLTDYQPGTIKSYLCSISTFLKFAFAKDLLSERIKTLTECTNFIQNSMRYLAKKQSQRQVEVDEQATEQLLAPEARAFILNGEYVYNTYKQFKINKQTNYNAFRDALMLQITVSNGTRVSAIMNMTVKQIERASASVINNVDYHTISVLRHKTSASRGAAKVSLPKKEYQLLKQFAQHVSTTYPEDDRVFRNQMGAPFTAQSVVNYRLQQAWRRCGGYTKFGRLNSKINRQTITCAGRERDPTKAKQIADQLKHKLSTADKFYHVYSSASASAQTVHWLNQEALGDRQGESVSEEDSEDGGHYYQQHDIPGLTESITPEELRLAIVQVLQRVVELMEEAAEWKGKSRQFSVDTSYLSIHRAIRKKLQKSNINLDEEILSMLSIDTLNSDPQMKTTFLSLFAVDLARHYGCQDDVLSPPTHKKAPTPLPPPPQKEGKGKGKGKKTVDTPPVRRRIAPEVEGLIKEVFSNVIENAVAGREPVLMKHVRAQIHRFPDFTRQQIRDKLINIIKYKK